MVFAAPIISASQGTGPSGTPKKGCKNFDKYLAIARANSAEINFTKELKHTERGSARGRTNLGRNLSHATNRDINPHARFGHSALP
jgi:hypothetical protein